MGLFLGLEIVFRNMEDASFKDTCKQLHVVRLQFEHKSFKHENLFLVSRVHFSAEHALPFS